MKWVGITGSIGTGKSTVSQILRQLGYQVLDADLIAKKFLDKKSPVFEAIVDHFGKEILDAQGEINKKILAEIVFNNKNELNYLESLTHPLVQKEVQDSKLKAISENTSILFYDVPLLYEKKLQDQFDFVVVVSSTLDQQIERIKKRNNWSNEEIKRRISNQIPLTQKEKLASYVIQNNSDMKSLEEEVGKVIKSILSLN
ncbi:MAG: dephospho-CoA kinase [Bdellovibrionales bacterium]|nr:dephospho-CoA kinase [Bdellovibrionales bacterium]